MSETAVCAILQAERRRFGAIAYRCCRYGGLNWSRDEDDLVSIVTEVAWELLLAAGDPPPESWDGLLFVRSAAAVRAWAQSGAVTGVGGMSGAMRRQALAHRTRVALARSLGREPTWQEIQDASNAAQARSRVNPAKSGALLTEADRQVLAVVPTGLSPPPYRHIAHHDPGGEDGAPFDRTQVPGLAREIIRQPAARSREHELVAREWLRSVLVDGGLSDSEVVRRVGLTPSAGMRRLADVRSIAQALCRARFADPPTAIR